ncbi:hypothetical protein ARAM_002078 [Aspergillus rambellii]|uniref:Uncharacterized protein n=1 Tax=Aspergillus rambellii TaxID=308745 RepID=A0A0F8V495_9EURO|nr:hypothetical protein ARAM_002078 [Aspergillus rambellii]
MAGEQDPQLHWSSQFTITPSELTPKLPGDKIILPQSALEQLLAAAPLQEVLSSSSSSSSSSSPQGPARPYTSTFDPFNPYTFAAESRAREHAVDRQHQLPHPLTFRIVNPKNGRVMYAGIREFSAPENQIGLSPGLREALGIEDHSQTDHNNNHNNNNNTHTNTTNTTNNTDGGGAAQINGSVTVHARQLPKGTYVRLRPLEAGYDPEDWKALLEHHLRDNYTTLTTGEVLSVSGGQDAGFRFLVDRVEPEGEAICVVDTDLEVDIVALSEDQARETLQRRLAKAKAASSRAPAGSHGGSGGGASTSAGGVLELGAQVSGQVLPGEYVDYELRMWDREHTIAIDVEAVDDAEVALLVSPLSTRQRHRPREDEFVFGELENGPQKRIQIRPTNVELEGAELLYISVHAFAVPGAAGESPSRYHLRVGSGTSDQPITDANAGPDAADDVQCKNCQRWVPQRTFILHESFCFRNNVLCPQCKNVFQKRSPEWQNHWHCPHDSTYGNGPASKQRHDSICHSTHSCRACGFSADSLQHLAQHRTTVCPAKPILCQFCHLVVPQQGESDPDMHDPEVLLSGLTPHELVDGGRTTECHLCNKIIRLRDMKTHLRHHDLDRLSRPPPQLCLNQNCGRTLDGRGGGVQSSIKPGTDTLGLCSICFGPLYVDTYDPEGKALRRRIERRYLSQLMTGCGKPWCQNEYCKTGKQNHSSSSSSSSASSSSEQNPNPSTNPAMSAAAILALIRPMLDAINFQHRQNRSNTAPFYLCSDQVSQQRRVLAEMLAAVPGSSKTYDLPWCVAAVEAAGELDKARECLG